MESYNKKIGKLGEAVAAQFFKNKNYVVIDQNVYTRYGEIDLIVENDQDLLFVEVKARTSEDYGLPEVAVDHYKLQKIIKSVQIYIRDNKINKFWRLDAVAIQINSETKMAKVRWFKNLTIDF